jgi:thymidylate synthase (FAD)
MPFEVFLLCLAIAFGAGWGCCGLYINEMSGRFGELPELVYVPKPEQVAYQSRTNKQGRGEQLPSEMAETFCDTIRENGLSAFDDYHTFLGRGRSVGFTEEELADLKEGGGISRELARIDLPLNTYTQWAWKIDLHNLFHFLGLRLHPHAQWEIRQYALAMADMVKAVCPVAWEAFEDYRLHSMTLSRGEIEVLRAMMGGRQSEESPTPLKAPMSKGEIKTFAKKLVDLSIIDLNGQSPEEALASATRSWLWLS